MKRLARQLKCYRRIAANTQVTKNNLSNKIVLATSDTHVVSVGTELLSAAGYEVLTPVNLGLPGAPVREQDASEDRQRRNALDQAIWCAMPAGPCVIGAARTFRIVPLARNDRGLIPSRSSTHPTWHWNLPCDQSRLSVIEEFCEATSTLVSFGYLGPDDRGAFFETVLCVAWPDGSSMFFESKTLGQISFEDVRKVEDLEGELFASHFIPDGFHEPLIQLDSAARSQCCDTAGAIREMLKAFD